MRRQLVPTLGRWITRLLLAVVLALVAFAIAVLVILPRAEHGVALTVLTGSMTPGIPVGSVVIDRPVDPATLHVGDVATYQVEPGKAHYITHRIIKIDSKTTPTTFTFKGDANRGPDLKPVPATAIRGKVWFHVPYLGAVRDTLHTKGGLAGVAMLILAGYAFFQFAGLLKDRRPRKGIPSDIASSGTTPDTGDGHQPASIVAVLPIAAFDGLSPELAAALLRGRVIDQDGSTFTAVVPDNPSKIQSTVELLRRFDAVRIEVVDPANRERSEAAPDNMAVEAHGYERSQLRVSAHA